MAEFFEIKSPKLNNPNSMDLFFKAMATIPVNCQELHVNFNEVNWITPYGLLSLVLITEHWCKKPENVVFFKEINADILAYLERIDYFRTFANQVQSPTIAVEFKPFNRSVQSNQLLEITRAPCEPLLNAQAQAVLLPRAKSVLMSSFAEKANSIEKILTIISEITGNIPHGQKIGYCAMQTYEQDRRSIIHIAIADLGIGIRGSLSKTNTSELDTDLSFIKYALRCGTTSSMTETRGLGLAGVYNSIKELSGLFRIRSGTACIFLQKGEQKSYEGLNYIPGTQVEIIVRE